MEVLAINVQNIPRKLKVVKQAIVPKLDALLFFDYAQIEYRLLAYYVATACGIEELVEVFKAGKDFHTETARRILGLPDDADITDDQRQPGKHTNFAAIYGGGVPAVMRQSKLPRQEARKIYEAFHEQHPYIGRSVWINGRRYDPESWTLNGRIKAILDERKYITTLWGRHLHPESEHKAINALIQGCAADLLRASLVSVHDTLKENGVQSHIINNVHDEIQVDAKMDELDVVIPAVKEAMCGWPIVTEVLPIETDVEISLTNWAEKKPLEEVLDA